MVCRSSIARIRELGGTRLGPDAADARIPALAHREHGTAAVLKPDMAATEAWPGDHTSAFLRRGAGRS